MDSETLLFLSKEGIVYFMFLLFFWTFTITYFDYLLHRYQVPNTYSFKYTHNTHILDI